MPILLDEPFVFNPGHGEPEAVYNYVMVIDFRIRIVPKTATICVQYGNVVDGYWIGSSQEFKTMVDNIPEQVDGQGGGVPADNKFDDLMSSALTSAANVSVYDEVSNSLYQYLIDEGLYNGEIV